MATTVKQQSILAKLEYIIDHDGKKHHIYPMLIKDIELVAELYSKINDEFAVLNVPMMAFDNDGNPMFDDNGVLIMDTTAFDAQCELLTMALKDEWDNIAKWIDIVQIQDIMDAYKGLSRLKKKMEVPTIVFSGEL